MNETLEEAQTHWHGSRRSCWGGIILCLLLTTGSFWLVASDLLDPLTTLVTIAGFALTQAIGQLIFFLHFGTGDRPDWEELVFYSMITVVLILTLGTLWIMHNLMVRMMI